MHLWFLRLLFLLVRVNLTVTPMPNCTGTQSGVRGGTVEGETS
jgi:hypothetical protein